MVLIFRISAGIIIGLLGYQLIQIEVRNYRYNQDAHRSQIFNSIDSDFQAFLVGVEQQYRLEGRLPIFASDISCRRKLLCGAKTKDGVFYFSQKYHWMSVQLFLENDEVKFRCKTTFKVDVEKHRSKYYEDCMYEEDAMLPVFEEAPFECKHPKNWVERSICRSDRLTAQEVMVNVNYLRLLERSSEYNKRKIVSKYKEFKKTRLMVCKKVKCLALKNVEILKYLSE